MIVVGLCGVAGVGKDVGAAALVNSLDFTRIGFADALRASLLALNPLVTGIDHPDYWFDISYRLSDVIADLGWDVAKRVCAEIRELQQRMGTEVGREIFGQSVWVDALYRRAAEHGVKRLVIPDVRFPNELQSVIDRKGICFRIKRPGYAPINDHASDNALTDFDFSSGATFVNGTTEEEYQSALTCRVTRLIEGAYFD